MSELVDRWEDKTAGDMTVWMHRKRSTGGRSVSPHPVVYECRTCNGTGEVVDHNLMEMAHCTDCVSGWVTNLGTIRRHCSVHDSWPTLAESDLVCLQGDDDYLTGARTSACVFGLTLVIPIGDGALNEESEQRKTPRELWGTCCLDDPECEHSFLEADELSRYMDTPIGDHE